MPASKRKTRSRAQKKAASLRARTRAAHSVFWPLVGLMLILWVIYRALFDMGVTFDETIGKAIFFGFPVWVYVSITGEKNITDSFDTNKLYKGMLLGLAVGGLFGFAASLSNLVLGNAQPVAATLFSAPAFWWEFFLAMMTAFWETLFFFSWIMSVILTKYKNWPLLNQVLLTAAVFTIFHLPNTILRFDGVTVILAQAVVLALFAAGQAYVFSRWRNFYALVLSHAFWGMVLLVHVM